MGPLASMGQGYGDWACPLTVAPTLFSLYFNGISRTQAQQLLLSPAYAPGAFLVRPRESSQGAYSLSGTKALSLCPPEAPWAAVRR